MGRTSSAKMDAKNIKGKKTTNVSALGDFGRPDPEQDYILWKENNEAVTFIVYRWRRPRIRLWRGQGPVTYWIFKTKKC